MDKVVIKYIFSCIKSNDQLLVVEAQLLFMIGRFPPKPSEFRFHFRYIL